MNFAHKISATEFLSDIILFGRHRLFIQCLIKLAMPLVFKLFIIHNP